MKLRYLAAIAAAGFVAVNSTAHAADEGWYVSGQAGISALTDSELDDPTGVLAALGTEVEFDPGFSIAGAVGYHWHKFRVEGEVGYAVSDIDRFTILGIGLPSGGDVDVISFMANAFRDFDLDSAWSINVGAGLGVANVSINDPSILGFALGDDDDTAFAYQLGAGIGYAFTRSMTVSLDYRFFSTPGLEFSGVDAEYDNNIFRIGVRYLF